MTEALKQQIEKEAKRRYKLIHSDKVMKVEVDAFIAGAEYRDGLDGWVKVSERLPELPKPYRSEYGFMAVPVTSVAIVFDGENVFEESYDENGFKDKSITHWMPLPAKPKQ
jgi:hypothetical protein